MPDIFTALSAAWAGPAVQLAMRPVPVRPPHPDLLPDRPPSAPPAGPAWFDVLTARYPGHIAGEAARRDQARAAGPPVLHVQVGHGEAATRYEVDPRTRTVTFAVTDLQLRQGQPPVPLAEEEPGWLPLDGWEQVEEPGWWRDR